MMNRFAKTVTHLVVCAALSLAVSGCANNQDNPENAPELPPVGSLEAEITAVDQAPAEAKNADPAGGGQYANFANAWVRVQVLRLYAATIILVPSAVMAVALSQEPVKEGATWVWDVEAANWSASLQVTAGINGWDVNLYGSNQTVQDFLWIEGDFALDLSSGRWLARSPELPADANEVLTIEWTYNGETDRSLTFTNVNASSPDVDDVLRYTLSGTGASLVFEDASDPSLVANINWDTTTGAGSIQVPGYNDGAAACWDTAFMNAACQ